MFTLWFIVIVLIIGTVWLHHDLTKLEQRVSELEGKIEDDNDYDDTYEDLDYDDD